MLNIYIFDIQSVYKYMYIHSAYAKKEKKKIHPTFEYCTHLCRYLFLNLLLLLLLLLISYWHNFDGILWNYFSVDCSIASYIPSKLRMKCRGRNFAHAYCYMLANHCVSGTKKRKWKFSLMKALLYLISIKSYACILSIYTQIKIPLYTSFSLYTYKHIQGTYIRYYVHYYGIAYERNKNWNYFLY